MADISGSYNSNQSYNPKFVWSISYSETGRSASAVTYNFNVSFTRTNGSYGYDIIVNWNIGGATGSKTILAANNGSASASTSFSVTCSTNAAGGTLGARIYTSSSTDSTHWMNAMDTGSQTVNKSTFNTPPSISGSVTAAGITTNGYIAENTSAIALSWPAATDPNNNLSGYRIRVSINNGSYTELYRTTSRTYSHNVSGYGEGTSFRYVVDAYDSYGEWSGNIYSGTITKNTLTAATITTSSQIGYVSSNGSITFTVTGGSNTSGASISSRRITCDKFTVYNNSVSTGSVAVTIYVSGTLPTGPYIKFNDIVTAFSTTSYNGSAVFTLTTTNSYGLSKTETTTMSVDIRTNPNAVSSCSIVEGPASTAYKTITATGNSYFIPDTGRVIRVTWGGGSGKLGETITYSLYVAYGSGSWQLLADKLPSTTNYYDHSVPKQTTQQTIKYLVRVVTSYDYYTDNATIAQNLHYYNSPTVAQGTLTRTATTCAVVVTVKSNSSIPNINTVGTWTCTLSTTSVSSGSLDITQGAQTINVTGLVDNSSYTLTITYNDNTGFSTDNTYTVTIGVNTPIVFVNKYGLGVGGAKATSSYALNISGNANVAGVLSVNGNTVYHVGNKPTKTDVGLGSVNNWGASSSITANSTSQYATTNMVYQVRAEKLNITGGNVSGDITLASGKKVDLSGLNFNNYSTWGTNYSGTGGGAAIVNDNGTYKSLMILGNNVAGGDRLIKMWDTLDVQGNLKVSGSHVADMGTNADGSAYYIRYYNGVQIAWGRKWYGSISQQNYMANAVYGGNSLVMTFPVAFSNVPVVTANCTSTGYANSHSADISSTYTVLRFWSNYATTPDGIEASYIAIGRWK